MEQELITNIVITIVYMQLFVQWHDEEYVLTHQEVPSVRLSYDTKHLPEVFQGFLSPVKQKQATNTSLHIFSKSLFCNHLSPHSEGRKINQFVHPLQNISTT